MHKSASQDIGDCLEAPMWVGWEAFRQQEPEQVTKRIEGIEGVAMVRDQQERVGCCGVAKDHGANTASKSIFEPCPDTWFAKQKV
mmetsp:Transcript_22871/g.53945  ORF Transcript_22871/g.53945 Transcript_22871/m.53945 type:complete len:85 (+) Transcript_22871:870-1124(+)